MSCCNPIKAWQKNCYDISQMIKNNESGLYHWGFEKQRRKLTFKNPNNNNYRELKVPCGKCIGCLLDKANDWATRAYAESTLWKNNCFITLTYNDENLPKNASLMKKDLQDFWKRLRYYFKGEEYWENPRTKKYENPIRYIVAGEYGPKTNRPHYHALVFNFKPKDLKYYKTNHNKDLLYTSKTIEKIWGKGFVIIGECTYQSACYVSRYVMKKRFQQTAVADMKEKEFIETSRNGGIGLVYWLKNKAKILTNQGILLKTKDKVQLKKIPKYFMRKWKDETPIYENPENFYKYKYNQMKQGKENWNKILKNTSQTESDYIKTLGEILKEKAKILRRDNLI